MSPLILFLLSLLTLSSLVLQGECSRQLEAMHGSEGAKTDLHLQSEMSSATKKLLSRPKHDEEDHVEFAESLEEEVEMKEAPQEVSLLFWCLCAAGMLCVSLPIVIYRKRALAK